MPADPSNHLLTQTLDHTNRLFVAAILREHRRAGTLPPRWTATDFIVACNALGLRHGIAQPEAR